MKSLRILGPGKFELSEIAIPVPAQGELLLSPVVVGMCATDLELIDGSMVYLRNGLARFPFTPGHEWVARIDAVGDGVSNFSIGDLVVGECSIGCGNCDLCLTGAYNRCLGRLETGVMNLDGALSESMLFPADSAHLVPVGVRILDAVLVEPLAIAFRAIQRSRVQKGESVLVVGAGSIGLLTIKLLVHALGIPASIMEPNAFRLDRAEKFGAVGYKNGDLFTHVIEASGAPAGIAAAHGALAAGGRLVLVGLTGQETVSLATDEIVVKDQEIIGSLGSPGVWPQVLELLASAPINPSELVTHHFPLTQIQSAIDLAREKNPNTGKILIWPKEVLVD